jgi:hypothetical protein
MATFICFSFRSENFFRARSAFGAREQILCFFKGYHSCGRIKNVSVSQISGRRSKPEQGENFRTKDEQRKKFPREIMK